MKNKILEDTILNKGSTGALEIIEKLRSTGKNSRNNFNKLELQNYGSAIRRAESSVKQASKFLDVLMITDKSKSLMVEIFKEFNKEIQDCLDDPYTDYSDDYKLPNLKDINSDDINYETAFHLDIGSASEKVSEDVDSLSLWEKIKAFIERLF